MINSDYQDLECIRFFTYLDYNSIILLFLTILLFYLIYNEKPETEYQDIFKRTHSGLGISFEQWLHGRKQMRRLMIGVLTLAVIAYYVFFMMRFL